MELEWVRADKLHCFLNGWMQMKGKMMVSLYVSHVEEI